MPPPLDAKERINALEPVGVIRYARGVRSCAFAFCATLNPVQIKIRVFRASHLNTQSPRPMMPKVWAPLQFFKRLIIDSSWLSYRSLARDLKALPPNADGRAVSPRRAGPERLRKARPHRVPEAVLIVFRATAPSPSRLSSEPRAQGNRCARETHFRNRVFRRPKGLQ
jgi:hypothetical protein